MCHALFSPASCCFFHLTTKHSSQHHNLKTWASYVWTGARLQTKRKIIYLKLLTFKWLQVSIDETVWCMCNQSLQLEIIYGLNRTGILDINSNRVLSICAYNGCGRLVKRCVLSRRFWTIVVVREIVDSWDVECKVLPTIGYWFW